MRVRFQAPAKREFDQAKAWYAAVSPGLGQRFADEVYAATRRIARMPAPGYWHDQTDVE